MFDPSQPAKRRNFLKVATYFEGGLVLAAYFIGWLGDADPLANLRFETDALLWGLAGTVPLYLLFLLSYYLPVGGLRAIKRFLIDNLGPFLDTCQWTGLLYLALLAGLTEEILFAACCNP